MMPLQRPVHPHQANIQALRWLQTPCVQGYPLPLLAAQILIRDVGQIPAA